MAGPSQPSLQNWLIVAFGFTALALAFSTRAALGLIMPVWQSELGWSSSFISGAGAAALIVMAIVAPFAGRLVDRKTPQFVMSLGLVCIGVGSAIVATASSKIVFIIGYSGFCGVGFGIVATHVVSTAVVRVFDKNQGLATGIATSGATGGQFLVVPLIAVLLIYGSWRWSFAVLSVSALLMVPLILWLMGRANTKDNVTDSTIPDRSSITEDLEFVLSKPTFHILFWSFLICGFTTTGVIETHFLPFASHHGFPPISSAAAYGVLSAVNLFGMILAGWLSDRVNRQILLASIYLLRALTFILLTNVPGAGLESLFLFSVLFGVVDYSTIPVTVSLVASHVGRRVMGLAMGLIAAGHAVGGALGSFLGGYLFDAIGNYEMLWTASLWLAVGAGAMVLLIPVNAPDPEPA
jgi:MFS family permease